MLKIIEKLLNLIYIKNCYFCGSTKYDEFICPNCRNKIYFFPPSKFKVLDNVDVYNCTMYEGPIKKIILDIKYYNKRHAAAVIAKLMYEYWQKLNLNGNYTVVPVPIHKNRKKERKYNHMELIAKEFCALSGYNCRPNFLLRVKDTLKQYNLHKKERIENIKNAFEVNEKEQTERPEKILIIDDITATGTTLEEIIALLKRNSYQDITALTLSTPNIWN